MRSPLVSLVLAMAGMGLDASNPNLDLELAGAVTPSRTRLRIGSKVKHPSVEHVPCRQSEKDDDLPRGFPGAKMLRKIAQKRLGIAHRRGPQL